MDAEPAPLSSPPWSQVHTEQMSVVVVGAPVVVVVGSFGAPVVVVVVSFGAPVVVVVVSFGATVVVVVVSFGATVVVVVSSFCLASAGVVVVVGAVVVVVVVTAHWGHSASAGHVIASMKEAALIEATQATTSTSEIFMILHGFLLL